MASGEPQSKTSRSPNQYYYQTHKCCQIGSAHTKQLISCRCLQAAVAISFNPGLHMPQGLPKKNQGLHMQSHTLKPSTPMHTYTWTQSASTDQGTLEAPCFR